MSEYRSRKAADQNPFAELTTTELNKLLSEIPLDEEDDIDYIIALTNELKSRDDTPVVDVDAAWENFKSIQNGGDFNYSVTMPEIQSQTAKKPSVVKVRSRTYVIRRLLVAALIIIATFSFAIAADAFPIIRQAIAEWTDEVFSFNQQSDEHSSSHTHLGVDAEYTSLQDALTQNGVTEKLVPTWLPEEFTLYSIKVDDGIIGTQFEGIYHSGKDEYLIIKVVQLSEVHEQNIYHHHEKDSSEVREYITYGITHYIMTNVNTLKALWSYDDFECSIVIPAEYPTDSITKIIDSIYER